MVRPDRVAPPAFVKLWTGQSISLVGSEVTRLALPLAAALSLGAGPVEMGVLRAAAYVPFLVIGLPAGVWVDRVQRRPVLIGTDLGRALLIGLVPLAAVLGVLRMELLFAVAFGAGILTVFFELAYAAYVQTLVAPERLVQANARLETSRSVAQVSGPGLGGVLVQVLTAPGALLVDALSFVASALFLVLIRTTESPPAARRERISLREELLEGLRAGLAHPALRRAIGATATLNLFVNLVTAVYILYATDELGIAPAVLGVVWSVGNVGLLLGALLASRVSQRWGVVRTMTVSALLIGLGWLVIALTRWADGLVVAVLVCGHVVQGLATAPYNVSSTTLRQQAAPDRLQGRVVAGIRFVVWGTIPVGALAGGVLGSTVGLWAALVIGALGMCSAALWFVVPTRS